MNPEILATFDPLSSAWSISFWLTTLFALAAGVSLWYLLRGKPAHWRSNMRMLVAMLAFFALLIAGGTAFFSAWAQIKKSPIVFYGEMVETPYGNIRYDDIKSISFEMNQQTAAFNPNIKRGQPVRFLMIQGSGTQVAALSETDYPIDEIAATLADVLEVE